MPEREVRADHDGGSPEGAGKDGAQVSSC
jgi:hypothetical protein